MGEETTGPDYWDAESSAYDDPADHGLREPAIRAAWRALLLRHLPPAPARVADLGCGTATLAALLAEEGYVVDGVDSSPGMLARGRAKVAGLAGVSLVEGVGRRAEVERLEDAAYWGRVTGDERYVAVSRG